MGRGGQASPAVVTGEMTEVKVPRWQQEMAVGSDRSNQQGSLTLKS
jgi:hypothetical protein